MIERDELMIFSLLLEQRERKEGWADERQRCLAGVVFPGYVIYISNFNRVKLKKRP